MQNWRQRLFNKKKTAIVGLDIGTNGIKAAEVLFRKDEAILKTVAYCELPAGAVDGGAILQPDAVLQGLDTVLHTNGIQTRDAVAAIGGRSAYMREVAFPAMSAKELAEAVRWDMEKYVPFPADTYYHDFHALEDNGEDTEKRVFLAAALKEPVDTLVNLTKEAGLALAALDLEALAMQRLLINPSECAIVDIGYKATQAVIYQRGIPVANRSIPIGGQHFTNAIMQTMQLDQAETERIKGKQQSLLLRPDDPAERTAVQGALGQLATELASDINRTLEYYQLQNKQAIFKKVYYTGGGCGLANLIPHLQSTVRLPFEPIDPWSKVQNQTMLEEQYLQGMMPRFDLAVGLALWGGTV